MSIPVFFRRGTTAQNNAHTGPDGTITVDTEAKRLRLHDGVTPGGTVLGDGNKLWIGTQTEFNSLGVYQLNTLYVLRPDGENSLLDLYGGPPVDVTAPSVPADLTVTDIQDTSLTITWSVSTDDNVVAGYQLSIDGGPAIDLGNVLTYQITDLQLETSYSLQIRAYDATGNQSDWSTAVVGTTNDGIGGVPSGVIVEQVINLALWSDGIDGGVRGNDPDGLLGG